MYLKLQATVDPNTGLVELSGIVLIGGEIQEENPNQKSGKQLKILPIVLTFETF